MKSYKGSYPIKNKHSLESFKVQKHRFGSEKNESKKYFGSEENFGPEKNYVQNNLGLKKFGLEKNVGSEKKFGLN